MIFVKKLRDTLPLDSPRFHLHRHLSELQDPRPLKNVHGSEVTKDGGLCARMYALADLTGTEHSPEWLTTSQAVTFEIGHLLEARIIHWFADLGLARTNWQCLSCGNTVEFSPRPEDCPKCGNTGFKPENYRFKSEKTSISCGIDLMLAMPETNKLRAVEIKTMDKDEFKVLAAPLAEHRIRTNLYMRTIAESVDPSAKLLFTDEAFVLYVSKGGFGVKDPVIATWGLHDTFSPFKEFKVKRNDKDTQDLIMPAETVRAFRKGLIGVPSPICATALTERAKNCPLRKACFSGKYPIGMKP